jgi:hypothetical protein
MLNVISLTINEVIFGYEFQFVVREYVRGSTAIKVVEQG